MSLDEMKKSAKDGASVEYGTTWKPSEAGDELAGAVREIKYIDTANGETYVLTIVDENDKVWTLWVSGIVLKNKLLDLAPGVGSLIVVLFNGKVKTKAGDRSYNDFQVVVDKPGCFDQWQDARQAYSLRASLQSPEVNAGGVTAPGDDGMHDPF